MNMPRLTLVPEDAIHAPPPFGPDGAPLFPVLRDRDWSASPLGPPAGWPPALRFAAGLVLESNVPMWVAWGEDLGLIYNDAYAEVLLDKHPAAFGAPLRQVWGEVWPDVAPLIAQALAGHPVLREDMPLVARRGGVDTPVWFSFTYTPVRDERGAVRGLFCTVKETTEKMRSQQQLEQQARASERLDEKTRETEARHRLALMATNDAIWDWRMEDGHVVWNQALHSLFGHEIEETSADWWLDHIHPDDRDRVGREVDAVIHGGGSVWSGEYRFRRADGSYAPTYDRGTVLRDEQGRALRMIGAMLDLTAIKAAQEAQRESERLFRTLFQSIDQGFSVLELLDGPHGPLSDYVHLMANPAFVGNTGIGNVVGRRARELVPLEAEGWIEIYRRVLLTGEPVRFERELEHTRRYLELAAFRIEPPERRQVAVLFQDITERHRAELALRELNDTLERRVAAEVSERARTEDALRQAQKMEAVGQLTGGIAHDFNNMLAVISNALELLGRRQGEDERAQRYVEMAKSGVRRAAQLTQRLLAFSRQQPLRPEPLCANLLLAGMADLLTHSLGTGVRIEFALDDGLWPVHADPNLLENAVLNLAVNARDAMEEGGRIHISTGNIDLDEHFGIDGAARGEYAMIVVRDTGSGMSPEVLEKAFDPFFTTKEVGRGSGLGLSQVYGFVRQSGGYVKIDSTVGKGSTVTIYLPRHREGVVPSQPELPRELAQAGGGETILVVDDEAAVRALSAEMLRMLGYHVLEADGALAALRFLDDDPGIALLFTDVVMPELNGRKLADEALRRRPALKVFFTTGYPRDALTHHGGLNHGVQLLGKPFSIEELAARVRTVLDMP